MKNILKWLKILIVIEFICTVFIGYNTFAQTEKEQSFEFLVRLVDKPNTTKKGNFITFKPAGWNWGSNERKHYGIVKIECSYEEAQALCAFTDSTGTHKTHVFDFETALSKEDLANWESKADSCKVIDIDVVDVVKVEDEAAIK